MPRPKLLDLFCGAGGAATGYHRAGFDVTGVDINPQPRYPFRFVQADATTFPLGGFDFIWASPPCQDHMKTPHKKHGTGWMLDHVRQRLLAQGTPWVIENVGNNIRPDITICGCQVGLQLRRVRFFETSWRGGVDLPPHKHDGPVVSVVGHGTPTWVGVKWRERYGREPNIKDYRAAMGIDWMNRGELSQAIPPAYGEVVGRAAIKSMALVDTPGA